MEINWLGNYCFRLKGKSATVITDPFEETEYNLRRLTANVITLSHKHPQHDILKNIKGDPKILQGPGEYEIKGMFIYAFRTFQDGNQEKAKSKNTAYLMEMDGIKACHLGDLRHKLSAEQVEELSNINILLIPITKPAITAELINIIEPNIVIPMYYETDKEGTQALNKLLKEIRVKELSPMPKLNVTRTNLPEKIQVVALERQAWVS